MAKAGTLPKGSYEVEIVPNTAKVSNAQENNDEQEPVSNIGSDSHPEANNDEILHYDDDDDESDIEDMATELSRTNMQVQNFQDFQNAEVGRETSFLLGGRSRYGRTVCFNNRFA
jgi:hypothetical protein